MFTALLTTAVFCSACLWAAEDGAPRCIEGNGLCPAYRMGFRLPDLASDICLSVASFSSGYLSKEESGNWHCLHLWSFLPSRSCDAIGRLHICIPTSMDALYPSIASMKPEMKTTEPNQASTDNARELSFFCESPLRSVHFGHSPERV